MMDGKRRWFGWVAVGLGALALVVALLGRGFGPQMAAGQLGANMQQQQSAGQQAGPGANAQPGASQQNAQPQRDHGTNAQPGAMDGIHSRAQGSRMHSRSVAPVQGRRADRPALAVRRDVGADGQATLALEWADGCTCHSG